MSPTDPSVLPIPTLERRLAPVMFTLAFVDLLILAGLIHRASQPDVTQPELDAMYLGLAILWPFFSLEAVASFFRRTSEISTTKAGLRCLLVIFAPPTRLAWIHPVTNRIWLPRLGWRSPGKELLKTLTKAFGGPMLVIAFLILPVLALEHASADTVRTNPAISLAVDLGVAAIWVAFAMEFIIKASAAPNTLAYAKERWLDLAIVGLPTLEFLLTRWVDAAPLARLLRLGRALAPDQIAKMGKAYRLRGLLMKGWHAVLVLEVVTKLMGNTTSKRLRAIDARMAELEEELAELRAQRAELVPESTAESSPHINPGSSGLTATTPVNDLSTSMTDKKSAKWASS